MNVNELPQYKCHKIVHGAKITGVEPGGLAVIVDLGKVSASIAVPEGWVEKHNPLQGDGYLVAYKDGYLSWSPAVPFEDGYHRIPDLGNANGSTADAAPAVNLEGATGGPLAEKVTGTIDPHFAPTGLDFSSALNWLKTGKRLARAGWNGAGQYVSLLVPHAPHPEDSPDANPSNPYFKMWDNNAQAEGTFTSFLILKNAQNKVFPWFPSMGDLMATDWQVIV